MKKLSVKFAFAIILAVLFIIGGGRANASEDGSSYLNLEVSKNQSGAYLLHINNVSKSNLKNIKGATTIPEKLKSEFGVSEVSWTLGELKSGESEVIPLNGKDKGKLPLLGSKQNFILTGLGLLFVLLFVAYLLNKKKFNMLLLLVLCLSGAVHAEKVFAQEKQAEVQIQTVFKAVDGNDYIFQSKVTFEVNDDGTEGAGEDKEIITVSGVAMDKDGAALKEKDLVIKSQNSSQTVTTDGEGNFFAQIEKGKDYQVVSDPVLQSVINVKSITDYQVDNKLGEVVLGKEFLVEGSDAYAKLNISTIYFEPSAEISHTETSLILSTVEKIQVGDIVVTGPRDDYDNGFSLKVDSIAIENERTVLTGTTPQLLEVFQEIHIIDNDLEYKNAKIELEDGVELLDNENQRITPSTKANIEFSVNAAPFLKKYIPGIKFAGVSSVMTPNINIDVSINRPIEEQVIDINVKNEQKLGLDFTFSSKEDIEVFKKNVEKKIGKVYIPTGIPILGIPVEFKLGAKLEIKGEVNFNCSYSKVEEMGIQLKNGKVTFPEKKPDPIFNVAGNLKAKCKLEVGAYPIMNVDLLMMHILAAEAKVAGEFNFSNSIGFSENLEPTSFPLSVQPNLTEIKTTPKLDSNSSISLLGSITLFSPVVEGIFCHGSCENFDDKVLSAKFEIEKNYQETQPMKFMDNQGSISEDNKLLVKPGQKIILNGININGLPLSKEHYLFGKPSINIVTIIDNSNIKYMSANNDQIIIEISDKAKIGDKASILVENNWGFIVYNNEIMDIIVDEPQGIIQLSGTIIDSNTGAPIENAAINFYDLENRLVGEIKSNKKGTYDIELITGTYKVVVKSNGYKEVEQKFDVSKNNKKLDIKLSKEETKDDSLWNQEKAKKLADFMKKLGKDLNQEFKSYNPENSVIMYGTPLPESILNDKKKMVIGKEPVEVEWSETGVGKKEYQLVEVYSNADTQPWLEKEVFFFMFKENKPMVVVTTQSEWRPNDYMYFYETKNKELQEAFVKISRSGSVEDEGL